MVLPAANLHHKDERRGHLLLHGRLWTRPWMESQMDGGFTRSGYSSHNCIIMISNITMIQRMYKTNSRKKIYDFVLDLGGRVEKLRNTTFDFIERNRRIPTFRALYQRMRKFMQRKIMSQSKQPTKSKIIPSNNLSPVEL